MKYNSGQFKKGVKPWSSGRKDIYSNETLEKMRVAKLGGKATEETRRKMSIAHSGCIPWNKGKKQFEQRRYASSRWSRQSDY